MQHQTITVIVSWYFKAFYTTIKKTMYWRHKWCGRIHQISDLDVINIMEQNAPKITDNQPNKVILNN